MRETTTMPAASFAQTENERAFVPGLDEKVFELLLKDVHSADELAERQAAFDQYRAAVFPHAKLEEWRRTDPARIPFAKSRRLPALAAGACTAQPGDEDFDAVVIVEDQQFQILRSNSGSGDETLRIRPLGEALSNGAASIRDTAKWGARPDRLDKITLAGEAFWNVGFFIEVAPGAEISRGVLIRYQRKTGGSLLVPRIVVQTGERSRLSVVEIFGADAGTETLTVASKRLLVGAGSQVGWYTLRDESERAVHLADEWASLARDAQLAWVTLNLGGRLIKARFTGDALEPGANADLAGLFFGSGEQHVDQKTLQVHSAPDTFSRLLYKGAVKDRAYSVYQGQIIARPGAVRVDAYQRNNNLVLNDGARADSMPGLQIDADDLKCSHGSTIGHMDDEQLFYLRSRGIGEREARAILIEGFFEEIAQRIPYERLRAVVQRRVRERIA